MALAISAFGLLYSGLNIFLNISERNPQGIFIHLFVFMTILLLTKWKQ